MAVTKNECGVYSGRDPINAACCYDCLVTTDIDTDEFWDFNFNFIQIYSDTEPFIASASWTFTLFGEPHTIVFVVEVNEDTGELTFLPNAQAFTLTWNISMLTNNTTGHSWPIVWSEWFFGDDDDNWDVPWFLQICWQINNIWVLNVVCESAWDVPCVDVTILVAPDWQWVWETDTICIPDTLIIQFGYYELLFSFPGWDQLVTIDFTTNGQQVTVCPD